MIFLGPQGPLRIPSLSTRPVQEDKFRSPYKAAQDHCQCQPIKPNIFWKLMTHTIHRPPTMTNTHTMTKTKTQEVPRIMCYTDSVTVPRNICLNALASLGERDFFREILDQSVLIRPSDKQTSKTYNLTTLQLNNHIILQLYNHTTLQPKKTNRQKYKYNLINQ